MSKGFENIPDCSSTTMASPCCHAMVDFHVFSRKSPKAFAAGKTVMGAAS